MECRSRAFVILLVLLTASRVVAAQSKQAESKEAKLKRALSAAPANIGSGAKIVDMDKKGDMTVLRDGQNGFTCVPDLLELLPTARPAWMPPACSGPWTGRLTSASPRTRSPELFINWLAIAIGVPLILGQPAELLVSGCRDG